MIYFVTLQKQLFPDVDYDCISPEHSLWLMKDWNNIQVDTETSGRDPHLCELLCIQFGNDKADTRIVVDTTTVNVCLYKELLESHRLILQNGKFDLQFLYSKGIIPMKVYDTMIAEQLLYLGYPSGQVLYSLKEIAWRRLRVNIDKTVRGEIHWRGLDKTVIMYAAGDVTYLEQIMQSQITDLRKKGLMKAASIECDFVPVIAYLEWCGIHLDQDKWKAKMKKDQQNLKNCLKALDSFVENMVSENSQINKAEFEEVFLISTDSYAGHKDYHLPQGSRIVPHSEYSVLSSDTVTYNYVKIIRKFPFCEINLQGDLFTGFDTKPHCIIQWSSSQQVVKFAKFLGFDTKVQDKKTGEDKDSAMEKHLKKQKKINPEFIRLYFGKGEPDDEDYYPGYSGSFKVCSSFGQGHLNAINPKTDRIHTVYKQLGAASGRMSCGSQQQNTALAKLNHVKPSECTYPNMQQLPHDAETRACFTAPKGYLWSSCDFSALESRLGADIYNEPSMINEYLHGSGDIHSLVAKYCFPDELKDVDVKDIKKLYPHLRSKAKGPEFAMQFGGSAFAIQNSLGCSLDEAEKIAEAYWKGFKGIADFKKKGSDFVRKNGYIVMCHYSGHKMFWWDHDRWLERQKTFTQEFWDDYREHHKGTGDLVAQEVREHFQTASKWDRMALNSVTQGSGIVILKIAMTNFFHWLVSQGYFGKVEIASLVHDESNVIFPEELKDIVPQMQQKCMEEAAALICTKLPIPAKPDVATFWRH